MLKKGKLTKMNTFCFLSLSTIVFKPDIDKERLILELEETIGYFEFTEEGMLDQISYLKNFLNVEIFHSDSLMTKRRFGVNPLFYMSSFSQFFDPPSDIYETAKNDGSIRLLRDKKLLRLLQKFHQSYKQRINQLIEEEYASGRKINDYLSESYGDNFTVNLFDSKNNLNKELIKNIVLKVRKDGSLRYKLLERIEMKNVRYRFLSNYKKRFQNLLKSYQ